MWLNASLDQCLFRTRLNSSLFGSSRLLFLLFLFCWWGHISSGISDNVARVIPDKLCAAIDVATWKIPPMFRWLKAAGGVPAFEMSRTYNCGIGGALIVEEANVAAVMEQLTKVRA